MTPEAGRYLEKSRRCLSEAEAILAIGLGESAARMAYRAAFHAAQALRPQDDWHALLHDHDRAAERTGDLSGWAAVSG